MFFELRLVRRFRRSRRRSLARFTSYAAVAGIAAGLGGLIFAQALGRGFQSEMQNRILANTAHITVFANDGGPIPQWRELKDSLENSAPVASVAAADTQPALLAGPLSTEYAMLRVDASAGADVTIGSELAARTGLDAGSRAEIITSDGTAPLSSDITISGKFSTGIYDYDAAWINVSPESFAALTGSSQFTPAILNVKLHDIYSSAAVAESIRSQLGDGYMILDWQEANKPLFAAMTFERRAAYAVLGLIIFIAALNITTTLALLVNERRVDIAVLRTCGATGRNLIAVFVLEGLVLGVIGVAAGIALGLLACFASNHFRLLSVPAEVYSLGYVPLDPTAASVAWTAAAAIAVSLTAAFYPAFTASRIKPLENLRNR